MFQFHTIQTVRYAVHARALIDYIDRLLEIFVQVLRHSEWSNNHLGLKMVALRGCTRLLEAYPEEMILRRMQCRQVVDWIADRFKRWLEEPLQG